MPGSGRGDTVPAPSRLCDDRESSDGLSGSFTASDPEEWAIARRRWIDKRREEGDREDRLFEFGELNREERRKAEELKKEMKEMYGEKTDLAVLDYTEEFIGKILEGHVEYDDIDNVSKIYAFAMYYMVREIIKEHKSSMNRMSNRLSDAWKGEIKVIPKKSVEKEDKEVQTVKDLAEMEMEVDKIVEEKGIQVRMDPVVKEVVKIVSAKRKIHRIEKGTQTEREVEKIITEELVHIGKDKRDRELNRKMEEMSRRIAALEKRDSGKYEDKRYMEKAELAHGNESWTTVTRRRSKRKEKVERSTSGGRDRVQGEENRQDEEEKVRQGKESAKVLRKRIPRGAGVMIELPKGTDREYEEIIHQCQEKISLEELGIPPLSMRRAREGGILVEVKMDRPEEKAEELAKAVKEVVGSKEGKGLVSPPSTQIKIDGCAARGHSRGDSRGCRRGGGRFGAAGAGRPAPNVRVWGGRGLCGRAGGASSGGGRA